MEFVIFDQSVHKPMDACLQVVIWNEVYRPASILRNSELHAPEKQAMKTKPKPLWRSNCFLILLRKCSLVSWFKELVLVRGVTTLASWSLSTDIRCGFIASWFVLLPPWLPSGLLLVIPKHDNKLDIMIDHGFWNTHWYNLITLCRKSNCLQSSNP